jgi:hypothetical protein
VQRDGIHLLVRNLTSAQIDVQVGHIEDGRLDDAELATSGDSVVEPGVEKALVWVIQPGRTGVACRQPGIRLTEAQVIAAMATFEALDPAGIYVPVRDLSCLGEEASTYQVSLPPQLASEIDQLRIARMKLRGLLPTDTLQQAGCPEQRHGWVEVVRERRVVAIARFLPGNTGFLSSCDDSGVRPASSP